MLPIFYLQFLLTICLQPGGLRLPIVCEHWRLELAKVSGSCPLHPKLCQVLIRGQRTGEGGSFALYQGLYPRKESDIDADRTLTGDTFFHEPISTKQTLKEKARWPLLFWVRVIINLSFFWLQSDRIAL